MLNAFADSLEARRCFRQQAHRWRPCVFVDAAAGEHAALLIALSAEIAGRPAFGVTLDDRTLDRIDDALTAEAQAAGSNMPVGLDPVFRLHSCKQSRAAGR